MNNIQKVVNWWAEQITANRLNCNNGDNSEAGGFGFLLMNSLALQSRANISAKQVETFKTALAGIIEKNFGPTGEGCRLYVDYHPDGWLSEALEAAGISDTACPCKSYTIILKGEAKAACGYGRTAELIPDLAEAEANQ